VILTNPSFATDIQEIFDRRGCTASNCHGGSSPQAGMLLTSGSSYANLVSVASTGNPGLNRVEPSDFLNSYLWVRVSGSSAGTRMPQGGVALDATDLANIMNWIGTGAPDN
jgi:hypothetical protein